jgi:hypothetical protein
MLFNLRGQSQFLNSKYGKAIFGGYSSGPTFGAGWGELSAWSEPLNGYLNGRSWGNKEVYNIPVEFGRSIYGTNMLTY